MSGAEVRNPRRHCLREPAETAGEGNWPFLISCQDGDSFGPALYRVCQNSLRIEGQATFPSDMTARPVPTTLRFNRAQAAGDRRLCERVENDMDRAQKDELVSTLHDTIAEIRSEEHTSELQSLMRSSYAVFCLKKNKHNRYINIRSTK